MAASARFTEDFAYEVLSVVAEIPEGTVATYGQIARLIGRDKNSRLVARVLSRQEGVELKDAMHVDLRKYQWEC